MCRAVAAVVCADAERDVPVSERHELHAPREDGGVLADPPLREVAALLAANEQRLARGRLDILGRSWPEMRRHARQTLLDEARAYLQAAGEPVPEWGDGPILMAGHQPALFHPGVWLKNFTMHSLARCHGATPINLVVDNDTIKTTALRLPALTTDGSPWPHLAAVAFDHWNGEVPYEEGTVRNETLFTSFTERVGTLTRAWPFAPLLAEFWPEVLRQATRTALLGERFAAARRGLERRWGCHNGEVPVSRICQTEPFAAFAGHLLVHLPRFHATYNACVHEYRQRYGIRSRNHPVPDLTATDGWLEVPLWAWGAGQRRRGRLLARRCKEGIELRTGEERWPTLPLDGLVAALQDLERHGFKVRSRALTNTLYARLFLTDLFMHGIGGGKYDELTDDLMRRFYEIKPPGYAVLSGTLLLPLPAYAVTEDDRRRRARELRDVYYNPQRHLTASERTGAAVQDLLEEKRALTRQQPSERRERRERFRQLREVTGKLRPWVAGRVDRLEQELAECEQQLQATRLFQRRDYPFCLYPERLLMPFCRQFQ